MTIRLPSAIEAYFEADRTGDPAAIVATFTQDAVVRDKGETHRGWDAICRWMVGALQQYSYTAEPFRIATAEDGRTQVTAHTVGTFPGSPIDLRFFFVLAGEKVAELEITV